MQYLKLLRYHDDIHMAGFTMGCVLSDAVPSLELVKQANGPLQHVEVLELGQF